MSPLRIPLSFAVAVSLSIPVLAQVEGHHDQTATEYQNTFDTLSAQGYRPITLSIHGAVGDERYSSVWINRAGPDWFGFHGATGPQYQAIADAACSVGYTPKILTATGSVANPRFAGVFEQTNTACYAFHGLDEAGFWDARNTARTAGWRILTADIYGDNGDPRYIVAFTEDPAGQSELISTSATSYQDHFDVMSAGHARPQLVATNDHGRYLSVWRSDHVGSWVSHHAMTSAQYQAHFDAYGLQGRYPISLQASGSGAGTLYAATWAPTDLPTPGSLTITGQARPGFDVFDDWVEAWMTDHEIRSASLAIAKQGRLVYARGYTMSDEWGYPTTQPTSQFRIASCSKPITSIAIHQHFQQPSPSLSPNDPMLNFFPGTVPFDARCNNITVYQLLTHQGGWDRDVSVDQMSEDVAVANGLGISLPVDKTDIFEWFIENTALDFTPGTDSHYSNFGMNILGQIIEERNNGMPYATYVDRNIFAPLGITRPSIAGSMLADLKPDEVFYHPYAPWFAQSVNSAAQPDVAAQYGARNLQNRDANGGWVMAAPDYAKLLASFDAPATPILDASQTSAMWTVAPGYSSQMSGWYLRDVDDGAGGTVEMYFHNGRLIGSTSLIAKRADGYSFVFFTNGDKTSLGGTQAEELSDLTNGIALWPNDDLFPSVGLPSCTAYTPGAFARVGVSCAGRLDGAGTPDVGQWVDFDVDLVAPSSQTFLLLGTPTATTALDVIGMPGCVLYVNPLVTFQQMSNGAGSATFPWQVPDGIGLIGATLRAQSATIDPGANVFGLTMTNGLNVTIGGWE
ncbi:MAG: serine hydrolase [Planctomycetes bacterium]|nr:serine hydrolase [Planctomycetota bacterium]